MAATHAWLESRGIVKPDFLRTRPHARGLGVSNPSYVGLNPASLAASAAGRGASKKGNTKPEIALRRELWRRGLRYRLHLKDIPGQPDLTFQRHRVAVFCDGDFWHGRNLADLVAKLSKGHNAAYWTAKIRKNVSRDNANNDLLRGSGWRVIRVWETDILRSPMQVADLVESFLHPAVIGGQKRGR